MSPWFNLLCSYVYSAKIESFWAFTQHFSRKKNMNWKLIAYSIHWPKLDVGISIWYTYSARMMRGKGIKRKWNDCGKKKRKNVNYWLGLEQKLIMIALDAAIENRFKLKWNVFGKWTQAKCKACSACARTSNTIEHTCAQHTRIYTIYQCNTNHQFVCKSSLLSSSSSSSSV